MVFVTNGCKEEFIVYVYYRCHIQDRMNAVHRGVITKYIGNEFNSTGYTNVQILICYGAPCLLCFQYAYYAC